MNKAIEEKVLKYIDDNCNEAFLKLSELVKIDTQNFTLTAMKTTDRCI